MSSVIIKFLLMQMFFRTLILIILIPRQNQVEASIGHSNVINSKTYSWITFDFYTVNHGAGIGNQMYEIASLYGIASTLHMKPFIQSKFRRKVLPLMQLFPALKKIAIRRILTKNIKFGSKCCSYENVELIRKFSVENLTLNGVYFQSHRYFDHIRKQVKELFSFSNSSVAIANIIKHQALAEIYSRMKIADIYSGIINQSKMPDTLVCVHVRRCDFIYDPELLESQETFTREVISNTENER